MIGRLIQVYSNNIVFTPRIRLGLYKIVISFLSSSFFYATFHLYQIIFLNFFCFPNTKMYILNIAGNLKKM